MAWLQSVNPSVTAPDPQAPPGRRGRCRPLRRRTNGLTSMDSSRSPRSRASRDTAINALTSASPVQGRRAAVAVDQPGGPGARDQGLGGTGLVEGGGGERDVTVELQRHVPPDPNITTVPISGSSRGADDQLQVPGSPARPPARRRWRRPWPCAQRCAKRHRSPGARRRRCHCSAALHPRPTCASTPRPRPSTPPGIQWRGRSAPRRPRSRPAALRGVRSP